MKRTLSNVKESPLWLRIKNNAVVLFFLAFASLFYFTSGSPFEVVFSDVSSRFFRNVVMILALVFPLEAGVGLNFGVTLGAMSAQLAIISVMGLGLHNSRMSFVYCFLIIILLGSVFGYLLSLLFNRTKGQEMVAGLMAGYFADGIYQFFLLIVVGSIIKISNLELVLTEGTAIKSTISLSESMNGGLRKILQIPYYYVLIAAAGGLLIWYACRVVRNIREKRSILSPVIAAAATAAVALYALLDQTVSGTLQSVDMPVVPLVICVVLLIFVKWFMQTKMGHDFNSTRNNPHIAASTGINVDRTRTIAIMLSTVLAGFGQLLYIQDLGAFSTYNGHSAVGTYAIAAILIGGATLKKASIKNVLIGNVLFQIIYSTAPNACKVLMNNAQVGEYFRTFMCYGIIAVAIAMYIAKELKEASRRAGAAG